MVTILAGVGAVVVFAAGWLAARTFASESTSTASVVAATGDASSVDPMYQDVLERHPVGVVVAHADGKAEYRNAAARALRGTHVGVLIDESIAKHMGAAITGSTSSETLELFGPPKRVVEVRAERLGSGRVVAFVDDITERRRADRVRTDFVANVSHELRTPIGAMMVLAETLVDVDDPEVIRRVVSRMQGEAERASRTIDDLLELSQIEAGVERDFGTVRLADVVRDAVGRVVELAAQREISISTLDPVGADGPAAESLTVDGDRRQLASAVGNVVENAVKYSEAGSSVQVRVRGDGAHGEIVVNDEGAGIPQHDLDRIFERFYRVDRARSRSTGGTGLGLSIVRHVMGHHGGTVTVDSTEGEGTTFVLRFPLAQAVATDTASDPGTDLHAGGADADDEGAA